MTVLVFLQIIARNFNVSELELRYTNLVQAYAANLLRLSLILLAKPLQSKKCGIE